MEKRETIVILDFYSQFNQLIARRVRESNVYSVVLPHNSSVEEIKKYNPKGIILTGGPSSVYEEDAPVCDEGIFKLGIPILGICYGMQLISHLLGGKVKSGTKKEYGETKVYLDTKSILFKDLNKENICLMSHTDLVEKLPSDFDIIASTDNCPIAAIENKTLNFYGIQFHTEVNNTVDGIKIIQNFLYDICKCSKDWTMSSFIEEEIKRIRDKVKDKKVLLGLSGGVDSSVAAVLLHKAIGKQLTCIFVDHGLLRKNEGDEVENIFKKQFDINLIRVNVEERFLDKLKDVSDPEVKRKIIGEEFIRVFEEESKKLGTIDFLAQGTIYPDVIESGKGKSAVIKSHHNVGGLPDKISFKEIIEPLRDLFKDEVRKTGLQLGIPESLVYRQPFPGPGLAIRVIGDITKEKLEILKNADYIFREEIKNAGLDKELNQYFAVLTNLKSVGVMGDFRTYDYTLALRSVCTTDFMTANWSKIPYDVLDKVSSRIVNEVNGINRIVYDITSKPPATIEWE